MPTYLNHDTLLLRACEPEDLDFMYKVENDSSLWEVGSTSVPYSRYALRQYLASTRNDFFADGQVRLVAVRKPTMEPVGMADLFDFDPLHNRASVGIMMHRDARRKGYAATALALLEQYAFRHLHLHQLCAFIPAGNEASLRLFDACGFAQTAVLKEWIRNEHGRYHDTVLVQKINKEG